MEQRMEEQSPAVGFLQNLWHNIVFVGFYPFVYLNEHHGPMASNAFGFVLMLLFFVVPRIFSSGRCVLIDPYVLIDPLIDVLVNF